MRGFGQFNYQVYIVGDDKELRHPPSLICPPFCQPNSQVSTPTLAISSLLDDDAINFGKFQSHMLPSP